MIKVVNILENNYYKILQLSDIFVNKYGYTQIVLEQYKQCLSYENWLYCPTNNDYKVIRITTNSSEQFIYDNDRFEEYISYFNKIIVNNSYKVLDIHICKEEYNIENEKYDYINLDENFNSGIDLTKIYPEIYSAIHYVKDANKEINDIVLKMKKTIQNRIINKKINKETCYVTYIIMLLCIINYIIGLILQLKYDDISAIMITLGADYKIFTLFLNQYYRLISCAFVHGGLLHLVCNMYCLYSIGRYVELRFGHLKYLIIILFSIICGSLTRGILSDNEICVGISGGLYGLLVIFIIDMLQSKLLSIQSLIPTILINLFLNFLSTSAWQAHLGGAIGGFTIYYCFKDKLKVPRIILCIVLLLCLLFKYVTIYSINNIYIGTDFNALKIYYDLGLKNYSEKLLFKLNEIYIKFGGY